MNDPSQQNYYTPNPQAQQSAQSSSAPPSLASLMAMLNWGKQKLMPVSRALQPNQGSPQSNTQGQAYSDSSLPPLTPTFLSVPQDNFAPADLANAQASAMGQQNIDRMFRQNRTLESLFVDNPANDLANNPQANYFSSIYKTVRNPMMATFQTPQNDNV